MTSKRIIERVAEFIKERELINPGDSVLLSVSAGKDSIAMLHILMELKDVMDISLGLFHLNHMIRGEEADMDERFVAEKADSMGLPLFLRRHDFRSKKMPNISLEEHAREIRYNLLDEIAGDNGYSKIATAHSKSDNVETMLMRLFTGTGIHGLTGITAARGTIIRPLLMISAEELYHYLNESGITWREDSSNRDNNHTRNYIRNEIMPVIKKRFPAFEEAMTGTKRIAEETMHLLDSFIRESHGTLYRRHGNDIYIETQDIQKNNPLFCHILAHCLRTEFYVHPTRGMLDEVMRRFKVRHSHLLLYENAKIRIIKSLREGKCVIILSKESGDFSSSLWEHRVDIKDVAAHRVHCPEIGLTLAIGRVDFSFYNQHRGNPDFVFIRLDETVQTIVIRNRRNGDRITLTNGTKKIKDYFIEKKLDSESKESVPLLIVNDVIAAIMLGFLFDLPNRVSSSFLVTDHAKKILAIASENHYTIVAENSRS